MLHITIPLLLAVAYFFSGVRRLQKQRLGDTPGMVFALFVLIVHGIWLGLELNPGEARISISQTLSLVAFTTGLIALITSTHSNGRMLAGLMFLVASGTVALTMIGGQQSDPGTTNGWPLIAHIIFSVISYTLLAVAAFFALIMAWKERQVRSGHPSALAARLPPLQTLDGDLFATIGAGFVLLSLAMFSGAIFIEDLKAQHLTHKTVLTIIAWLVFGLLLAGRWRYGWRGATAVRWTLTGFALLILAYFGSRLVLEVLLGRQWG